MKPMLTPIAYLEGLGLQRRKLNGWGPPQQDYLAGDYAVRAPKSSRAARAVFSAVIPSFSKTKAPGAPPPPPRRAARVDGHGRQPRRQHRVAVGVVLGREQLPRRHRHDARASSV